MKVRRRAIWLVVLSIFLSVSLFAQQDSIYKLPPRQFLDSYIYSGVLDAEDQITAPFHWNATQWVTFGGLAAGESAMMFAGGDKALQAWAQSHRNSNTNFIENNFGDPFGDGLYPVILIGSAYILGFALHSNHLKTMALFTTKSLVISASTTLIIKSIAERDRPFQHTPPNPLFWNGPIFKLDHNSFPSGHTTVAFATASGIAMAYPKPIIIPILAYSFAAVTAYGRVNGNWHWGSDVLMGAAIGYFTSKLIYTHDNWSKALKKTKPIISQ